jgi:hypothetical protein
MEKSTASGTDLMPRFAPSAQDKALLKAVLSQEGPLAGFGEWCGLAGPNQSAALDAMTGPGLELLPGLYQRLGEFDHESVLTARLGGVFRFHWTRDQTRRRTADAVTSILTRHGVEYMGSPDHVMGELSPDSVAVPLSIPRITVRHSDAGAALHALGDAGWSLLASPVRGESMRVRLARTEWQLVNNEGDQAVIGHFFNPWIRSPALDHQAWDRSGEASDNALARLPDPTDLFMCLILERADHAGALRWAVGALACARVMREFPELAALVGAPDARYLLASLEERLAFLQSLEPDLPCLASSIRYVQQALDSETKPAPVDLTILDKALGIPERVAAIVRVVRRYGGLRGTYRYLRSTAP